MKHHIEIERNYEIVHGSIVFNIDFVRLVDDRKLLIDRICSISPMKPADMSQAALVIENSLWFQIGGIQTKLYGQYGCYAHITWDNEGNAEDVYQGLSKWIVEAHQVEG